MLLSLWLSAVSELKLLVKQIKSDLCMTTTIYTIVTGMVTIREITNWHDSNCLDFTQMIRHECLECSFVNLPESELHIIRPVARELLDHVYSCIINECMSYM